jgi:Cu/Ag efflux protein CusF
MMVVCVWGVLCLATVALAQEASKPAAPPKGEAVVASLEVTAKVTKINQKTREVTLKADDGQEYSFVADPAVKNLAQVKKGDVVTATYTEALAYEVKKGGKAGAEATVAGAAAQPGKKPAAAIGGKVTVTVAIVAIDPKVPSVTFKGPSGDTRKIKVQDPAKLQGVNVGDTVDITYVEAIAIKVEAKKK